MMMRISVAALLSVMLAAACTKKSTSTPTPTVSGVVVTGNGAFTSKNQTSQLTATANLSDSTHQDVSTIAAWSSSNPAVASVSSTGLVTAVSFGTATISANYQGAQGSLSAIITLKATVTVTPTFTRLCGPFRARLQLIIAETGNSIGFDISSLTATMRDLPGNIQASKTYTPADLVLAMGGSHINAGSSRTLIFESPYPGNVDTMDSTATAHIILTDEAGNSQTIDLPPAFQHDGC
jgi:Bacterial Ig-like domain (group 2)